jgi:hypothetical protein
METNKFSTDGFMQQVLRGLIYDLIPNGVVKDRMLKASRDIKEWRVFEQPDLSNVPPSFFKRHYQIANFCKRYIFENDLHDAKELAVGAAKAFVDDQTTYGLPESLPAAAHDILDEAKDIVQQILGAFSHRELSESCKWGKRAALGLKAQDAYLQTRVNKLSYTTHEQLEWFYFVTWEDEILKSCLGKPKKWKGVKYNTVPKSYKTNRGIAPDGVIPGFLSQGLGEMLRARLETNTHISLAKAQERHKDLARNASKDGKRATIDMSKASDSFTWDHVARLVPRDWHGVLRAVRTPYIKVDDSYLELKSYMLMGSAHTFPLQTILFYSLAQAAVNLSPFSGRVSVFGDDIIMPSQVAPIFSKIMAHLGFKINTEKSFWTGKFRESCGGDYYDGCDVRPSMPEGDGKPVDFCGMLSFVFKVFNSLHEKWDVEEIPFTREIFENFFKSHDFVPPLGDASVHGATQCLHTPLPSILEPLITTINGIKTIRQKIIVDRSKRHLITRQTPYYWEFMRCLNSEVGWQQADFWNTHSLQKTNERNLLSQLGMRVPIGSSTRVTERRRKRRDWYRKYEQSRSRTGTRLHVEIRVLAS